MPYIGKSPVGGGFHKLDNLTASATATYALTLGGAAYYPETANQLLVSLNGVIQAPQDSFTVSGSNLIFDSALTASDSIDFVVALGDVLGVQGVTDGAITTAKIGNGAVDLTNKVTGVLPVANGGSNLSSLDYRSLVFRDGSVTPAPAWDELDDASYYKHDIGNTIGYIATGTSGGGLGSRVEFQLTGLVTGIYEIHAFMSQDRTTNASQSEIRVMLEEGGTRVIQNRSTMPTQTYCSASYNTIRDYTSGLPSSVVIAYECNHAYNPTVEGSGFIVKRIG
jgi:hypothetical protein